MVIVLLFNWVYNSITSAQLEEKSYTDFLTMVQRDQLAEVQFKVDRVLFLTKEEAGQAGGARTVYYTGLITGTDNTALVYKMQSQGVKVFQEPQEDNSVIGFILSNLLILGLTFFLLSLLMRKMGSAMGGGLGGVGQSKAKVYMEKQTGVTFADVAGQDEAKDSLQEIIDFLHNPQKYAAIGAKLPQGRAAGGLPRHRQDASRQGCGRGGQCALFLHLRFGFCGDVRGRRRQPGAGSVPAGGKGGPLYYFHRRN